VTVWRLLYRTFEVLLGLVLLVATLVPILLGAIAVYELAAPGKLPRWAAVLVTLVAFALAWFCVVTGWRLLTRHERPEGGLLHPWFLYVVAFYGTWHATGRSLMFGPEYAQRYYDAAGELLSMARSRRLKEQLPHKRLQPRARDAKRRG